MPWQLVIFPFHGIPAKLVLRTTKYIISRAVATGGGALVGLAPQTNPQVPQIETWNTINK